MIELFDCQCGFGGGRAGERGTPSAADCLGEMRRLHVGRALVRRAPHELDADVALTNQQLFAACDGHEALVPCPVLLPASGGDVADESEQVDALVRHGGGAAHLRPGKDLWLAAPWASGRLFDALQARRVPALCLEAEFGIEKLAALAGRWPDLPFLYAEVGYRVQRTLLPLLETFGNVHLSLGSRYTVQGGVEQLVARVGPQRLLFGTGYPDSDMMPAITMLLYADLDDDAKRQIAAGNLERLVGGILR